MLRLCIELNILMSSMVEVVVPYEHTDVDSHSVISQRRGHDGPMSLLEKPQMCKRDPHGKDGAAVNTEPHRWASKNQRFHFWNGKPKRAGPELVQRPSVVVCQQSGELSVQPGR